MSSGRAYTTLQIPECRQLLPKAPGGQEPLPEGSIVWSIALVFY